MVHDRRTMSILRDIYNKVCVCQNNALRPEANSCVPRRTSCSVCQSRSVHRVPFKNSPHWTNTESWRTQPLRSPLSLVEGRLFSTLSLRLIASPACLWPGMLEGKRSPDNFFAACDCFVVAFERVRGADFPSSVGKSRSC